ncbi:Bromodomain Adjacent To Zinc Finger Domain Protein 2B, partial [Manis pentadactyla]
MILTDMHTRLSEALRKGTTEYNDSGHLSKQPSCTSIKKPKQEESLYLTNCQYYFCSPIL